MKNQPNPLIYALDAPGLPAAREWAEKLADLVGMLKIGKQLFVREGAASVKLVHDLGGRVFLDLKFHDIPHTVSEAAAEATRLGVAMFNVHASGGRAMMEAARQGAERAAAEAGQPRPMIIAVTVLTSLSDTDLREVGQGAVREQVVRLAALARLAGLDGVVASPLELADIRRECGPDFLIVTPGIRPSGSAPGDQKRTLTPAETIHAGADYIVVGRPIRDAADPRAMAREILAEIKR